MKSKGADPRDRSFARNKSRCNLLAGSAIGSMLRNIFGDELKVFGDEQIPTHKFEHPARCQDPSHGQLRIGGEVCLRLE